MNAAVKKLQNPAKNSHRKQSNSDTDFVNKQIKPLSPEVLLFADIFAFKEIQF